MRTLGGRGRCGVGEACVIGSVIEIFAGFLGVGPGFLLMPTLVTLGCTARIATARNAVAVTLPSCSACAAHIVFVWRAWKES